MRSYHPFIISQRYEPGGMEVGPMHLQRSVFSVCIRHYIKCRINCATKNLPNVLQRVCNKIVENWLNYM